jgi:hypothetical protein
VVNDELREDAQRQYLKHLRETYDIDAINKELVDLHAQVARLQKAIENRDAMPCTVDAFNGQQVTIRMMSDFKVGKGMYWLYKAGD